MMILYGNVSILITQIPQSGAFLQEGEVNFWIDL